eukprot:scaffold3935_cov142-Skeletonema_menzelii.AAC.1
MMITAAANHRPTQDKYLGPQESSVDPSFLMYPPPNKKAKFRHHTDDDSNGHNSSEGAQHYNDDNDDRHILSSSPTDQKSSPSTRPQLVAFPTEALYVLTCCVKTTSKKKIIRANAAAAAAAASNSRNHDDSSTSSSSLVYSSSGNLFDRERQDLGGKPSSSDDDIHPSNPSLECLLSRQTPPNQEEEEVKLSSRASVFVIDTKHAQHYCQFSRPKSFAIRPKQPSPSSSDLATVQSGSSSLAASAAESGGDMDHSVSKSGAASKLDQLNQDEQKLGWGCSNNTYTPSSPKESSSTRAGERTPGCAMVGSTSSSSLCGPMTPDVGTANRTPLSTLSLAAAVTPIAKNTAIAHMDDSKMQPSLPLSNQNTPSNNHSRFNALGTNKILAVNFSESYEAFSRLANKFWPGPVIIYAPARMITVGDTGRQDTPSSSSLQQQSQSWKRSSSTASSSSSSSCPSSSSSSSCPSLPSFTNLYSLEKGEGSGNNSQEVPVLPPSVLIPARDLLFDNDGMTTTNNNNNKEDQLFIGMQCPSHPLARKILTEIYRPRRGPISTTTSSSPSLPMAHSTSTESFASFASLDASTSKQQQHVRCGIAVVGSYITPSSNGSGGNEDETKGNTTTTVLSNSATNVTKILSSSSSSSDNTNPKRGGTEQIYVVNGEDTTHENFSVPTCNYGGVSPMSLVVDGDNRTIYLLRNHHHYRNSEFVGGGGGGCNTVVNKDKIYRALLQPPSSLKSTNTTAVNVDNNCSNGKASSMREMDRVITAVMSRWKVVERHV